MKPSNTRPGLCHDDAYLQALFDRMRPTYGLMNVISAFGLKTLTRERLGRFARGVRRILRPSGGD